MPRSAGEADSGISFDEDIDRPAEDAPDPGGIVQGYLDRILTEVMHQTKGNSWPQCYKEGTFWIRPRDNWFILNDSDDGHNASKAKLPPQRGNQDAIPAPDPSGPEGLYYPRIFVWIPTLLLPLDKTIRCVFCGNDNMTDTGASRSLLPSIILMVVI